MSTAATPQRTERAGVLPSSRRGPAFRSDAAPDRLMRRLLGVGDRRVRPSAEAHRAFRVSVVVSAVRCLITYVLVPILSLSGWVAAPIGIALCVYAVVNGVISLKRFWGSEHPKRWMYTAFMFVVFVILAFALLSDFSRLGAF